MRVASTAGWLALVIVLSGAAWGHEPGSDAAAEALLVRAAKEARLAGDQAEFHVLLDLGRGLARFERGPATAFLAQAFERAKVEKDAAERLRQLEAVALAAGPVDPNLSTAALELARADPRCGVIDDRIELKVLAIDLALAYRKGSPDEAAILTKAKEFCRLHPFVREYDLVSDSYSALADYVSYLDPELGIWLWQEMWPGLAWEERIEQTWDSRLGVAQDLVHYDAARALPVLRALLEATPDPGRKVWVAVAMYKAGARDEAVALLGRLRPPAVGGGWPLGDLIARVAAADPEAALRLAATMGSDDGRRSAEDLAYQGAAAGRPKDVLKLIRGVKETYRRDSALRTAADSLVRAGDLQTARQVADLNESQGHRSVILARIAEATKDVALMAEALGIARTAGNYGRMWQEAAAAAIRAFGIKETEALLEQVEPELRAPQWKREDLYAVLLVVAEEDPAWALEVFKRGPNVPPKRNHTVPTDAVSYLLPKLAPEDGGYVADYIAKHGGAEHPQTLDALKEECVRQIARRSTADAQDFAARVGVKADLHQLEWEHRNAQVMKAGMRINEVLDEITFRHPGEREGLVESAVSRLVGGPNDLLHHVDRILVLAGAMKDKTLADKALGSAAPLLYACAEKKVALELIDKVQSPGRRAEALLSLTRWELDPRPRRDRPFLAGW